ncbi:MAG: F0F1 ATP synthase subunit A [Alphaproteobacteria bacterium]|nr:F0F1 ATP synthase subunit A [Alphaproteobacteria bacterium]
MLENIDALIAFHLFGIPINYTIFYSWVVMALLVFFAWLATRNLHATLHVSRFQTALEVIVMAMRSQIKDVSGDNPMRYLPIIGTFFLYIAASNLLTIIPWCYAPTSSLSTTGAFAFCVFCAIPIYGIRNVGARTYLRKYTEPLPILFPLNVLGDFSSVFALAFRLYGNVLSGAVIGSALIMLAPFLLPLPLQVLALLTGVIHAYIFALLAIVYVSAIGPEKKFIDTLNYY